MRALDDWLRPGEAGTTLRRELIAGLATFATLCYIPFGQPVVLWLPIGSTSTRASRTSSCCATRSWERSFAAMDGLVRILVLGALASTLVALAAALGVRARARRTVGRVLVAPRGPRVLRGLVVTAALALGVATVLVAAELALPCALLALATAALALASPARTERVCGADGLRAGWEVQPYEALAEWRLTGDHLRFRGAGEWSAVDAPRALQAELRAVLEVRCAGRESRFKS